MLRSLFIIYLLSFSQLTLALSYTITITEKELQSKIDARLPIERKNSYISAKIYGSTVELIEGSDQIAVFSNVDITVLGSIKGSGRSYVKGDINYEPNTGAFYLHNPVIVTLEVDDIPAELLPEIHKVAQLGLQKAAQHYPIYKLNEDDLEHKMAKAMLESVEVKDQTLLLKLNAL
jgi:hypothetical protein